MKLYKFEKIAGIQPSKGYLRNPKYQFEKIAAVATPYTTKVSKPSNKSNPTDMLPSNPQQPSITFGAGGSPMEGFLYPESPAAMAYRQKLDNRAQSQAIANARANIIGRATTQPVARKPNITRFEDLPQSSMKDKAFAYMDTLDQQGGSTSQGIRMPGFGNNNSFPSMYRPYVQPWQQQAPPLPQQPAPQSNFDLLASQPNPTNNIEIADSRIRNQGLLGQQRMAARDDALIAQQAQERARNQQALQQWGNLSRKELEGMGFNNPQDWYSKTPEQRREWFKQRQDNRLANTRQNLQGQWHSAQGNMTDMEGYQRYADTQKKLWGDRWRSRGKTDEEIDKYLQTSYKNKLNNMGVDTSPRTYAVMTPLSQKHVIPQNKVERELPTPETPRDIMGPFDVVSQTGKKIAPKVMPIVNGIIGGIRGGIDKIKGNKPQPQVPPAQPSKPVPITGDPYNPPGSNPNEEAASGHNHPHFFPDGT